MYFKDRTEAGKQLAQKLAKYKGKEIVVYALPRGGVVTAIEVARYLHAPLDLIITRKIGHPYQPEFAMAAIAENGHSIESEEEIGNINKSWLKKQITQERLEAKRRRETYLNNKKSPSVKEKIAILVDDGVATGLTMRVGILELKHRQPKKIVVAIPVIPQKTAEIIKNEVDELIALDIPENDDFLGAVGAYYQEFNPVEDDKVIHLLNTYNVKEK